NGSVYGEYQSGHVTIVEAEDGIYIKDLISHFQQGAWVKGTRDGNTITIAAGQPQYYSAQYSTTLSINWGSYVDGTGFTRQAGDITFQVDDEAQTISLVGSNEDLFIGIFWDDDNSFSGYGDYETVYTFDGGYAPATTDPIVAPDGLVAEEWYTKYTDVNTASTKKATVNVGFDGSDVYVQGLFADFPEAWVKGTIDGTSVTFSKMQYLGSYQGYNIWMTGATETDEDGALLDDFKMTYDAEAKTLVAVNDVLANASDEQVYYLEWFQNLAIQAEAFPDVIDTGAPVDELPYSNGFDTAYEQVQFGIDDSNADGSTWAFNAAGYAQYTYSSANDADDWLVSPAIKLEAGKAYHIALDVAAQASAYPERIEIKAATTATPAALAEGAQVIAATDVETNVFYTIENNAFTVSESGYYHFGLHAISDADEYMLNVDNFLVEAAPEPTAPAAVTDIVVTPFDETLGATITFKAPTTAINGEPLTENLTKIEIYRDGLYIGEVTDVAPGAEVTYTDEAADLTIGTHSYQIYPYNASGIGQKSEPQTAFLTTVLDVPYVADFTDPTVINAFSVIDANDDGSTWQWNDTDYAFYRYSMYNNADDYLISSPIRVEAGKNYDIVVEACAASASWPERFEVVVGNAPTVEALTQVAIEPTDLTSDEYAEYEGSFTAAETGTYFVAIHAISDADNYNLLVRSLSVQNGALPTAPAAIANLNVQAWPEAALTSVVKFTLPTKSVDGNNLSSNMQKVEIYRNGELIGQIDDNMKPGINKYFLDNKVPADGFYTYQVVAYNAEGERGAKSNKASTFVGLDVPATVSELTATDNGTNIEFQWTPVEGVGEQGGYVNTASVNYNVWSMQVVQSIFGSYLDFDQLLTSVQNANSVTLDFNTDEGTQDYKYWSVQTENANGNNGDAAIYSMLVGAPYELPMVEGFTGSALHYIWENTNSYLMISPDATDEDGVALSLMAEQPGMATFTSGKVKIAGIPNPTLIFDVKSANTSAMYVIGSVDGGSYSVLQAVPVSEDYTTVKVPLTDLKNGRFAQIGFMAVFANGTEVDSFTGEILSAGDDLVIDNIRVQDLYQYDLAAAVSVQNSVKAGEKATVNVTVSNQGENAADEYTVKVSCGDVVLLEQTETEALAAFKKKVFNAELQTSIFDDAADLNIKAEVIFANDLNEDNNSAEAVVSVKEATATQPTDLAATVKEDKTVELTWTAPDNSVAAKTEDFEDQAVFEPFSLGGITEEQHTGALGDWTVYDGNGINVYGFNGITFPGSGEPQAWQVMTPAQVSAEFAESYGAASGEQYLISFCAAGDIIPPTDHWLISPELPGVAQTISFKARALTDQYGAETFEVLASSSNNLAGSFEKVAEFSTDVTTWTDFSVNLPEGTTYFAIRHTSEDIFGLMVDDIEYMAGGSAIANYNIYLDRELLAITDGEETTFTTDELADGTYELSVSAVYANGNESKPISVTAIVGNASNDMGGETNGIASLMAGGKAVDIYTLGGKLVRSQATSAEGLKGVYVVNNKVVIIK
nr:choice-of-anchor J domain-containing protein [Prevotella sp.]